MKRPKNKIDAGALVRTNARYGREISSAARVGVALRPVPTIAGCWIVRLEGFPAPQMIHENYMEARET